MKYCCECGHEMKVEFSEDVANPDKLHPHLQCPGCGKTRETGPPHCSICDKPIPKGESVVMTTDRIAQYYTRGMLNIRSIYGSTLPYCKECYENYKK
jgi:predicted nucleic acid-binding Zn ribbon protein